MLFYTLLADYEFIFSQNYVYQSTFDWLYFGIRMK